MSDRTRRLIQGVEFGLKEYKIPKSPTGMYRAILTIGYDADGEPDIETGIEEDGIYCSVCLFLEDAPYNFGEVFTPLKAGDEIFEKIGTRCQDCNKSTPSNVGGDE